MSAKISVCVALGAISAGSARRVGSFEGADLKTEQTAATAKGPCPDYFGNIEGIVTVADADVGLTPASAPYCDSNRVESPCIYIHKAGPWRIDNECQSPGPPDGCHRYHTVKYSECDELEHFNFDTRIDTTGAFNTDGVFIACADRVIKHEIACYGPPADEPVPCECPEREPELKYPCENYFGDLEGTVTVVDPDVGHTPASAPYCDTNRASTPCIYMHKAGPWRIDNECQSPAPPDGCHRYHPVKYSECDELQHVTFDARIDTTEAFNTDGVFIACADRVISNEVHCYGPPADMPEACDCSGSQAYWSVEERPVNFNCCKEVGIDQELQPNLPDLAETAYSWCNPNRVPAHKRIPEFLQGLFWLKDYGDFSAIAFCTSLAEWDNETHTALLSPWMTWVEQRLWDDGMPPQELYKTAGTFGPEKPEGQWRHPDYDGVQEFPSPLLYELAFEMPDDPDEHHRADVGFTHSSRRIINWLARLPLNEIQQTPDGSVTRERPGDIWSRPSLLFGMVNLHHYYPVRIMDGEGNIHRERYELMKNSYVQRNATFTYCEWNCAETA